MKKIGFFNADVPSKLKNKDVAYSLIEALFKRERHELKKINYIFCSDNYLLELNKKYLNHKTLTDVITFPLSDIGKPIIGEIYISIERIRENAKKFNDEYQNELLRVIIHGALHLCGYSDKKISEKIKMQQKENFYLKEFKVPREASN